MTPVPMVRVLIVAAACVALVGCRGHEEKPLPTIDADRLARLVEGRRGRVVLVDFWATWCGPCLELLPHTAELGRRWRDRGLDVVSISLDSPDAAARAREFLERHRATADGFFSSYGVGPQAMTAFDIGDGALPHVKIYDAHGRLRRSFSSGGRAIDPREIEKAVEEFLPR